MLYLKLFWEFFKIGLFSIGGGLATLPFLSELKDATGWFTVQDMSNMIAVSESTPGPMGVNMATYVGNVIGGIPGGIIATLGLITPSIIVILIVSLFLKKFKDSKIVQAAFTGLRPASTALICVAMCTVAVAAFLGSATITSVTDFTAALSLKAIVLSTGLFVGIRKLKWHPVAFIGIAAVAGILFQF